VIGGRGDAQGRRPGRGEQEQRESEAAEHDSPARRSA